MEIILRSLFQVGNFPEESEALNNWHILERHNLGFPIEEDRKIHEYLRLFFNEKESPPDFDLIKQYFESNDDIETASRLEEIKNSKYYIRANYLTVVKAEYDKQQIKDFILQCRDAMSIAEHGKTLEKPIEGRKILKGTQDAVNYLYSKMSNFLEVGNGEKLEGSITEESNEFIDEYDLAARGDSYSDVNLFGMDPVDSVCSGHRRSEYWIHCASAGELKTTTALNYTYNNAYVYGRNMFYAMLEMNFRQVRRMLYVIHSSNGKFVTDWYDQDRKSGIEKPYLGINYQKVRNGKLNELEYKRLKLVAQDFQANCKGKIYIWRPQVQATFADIRRHSEIFHNKYHCDGLVVDYLGLVKPSSTRYTSTVDSVNSVVMEGRVLALTFGRGLGVPLLALAQINRAGKIKADKENGHYDFSSISYANQIEKDADVISYTYLNDQLRSEGKFLFGNMKNRDNPIFKKMVGKILWESKRMRALEVQNVLMDNDQVKKASNFMMDPDSFLT